MTIINPHMKKTSRLFCCSIGSLDFIYNKIIEILAVMLGVISWFGFNMTGIEANSREHEAGACVSSHRQCH